MFRYNAVASMTQASAARGEDDELGDDVEQLGNAFLAAVFRPSAAPA